MVVVLVVVEGIYGGSGCGRGWIKMRDVREERPVDGSIGCNGSESQPRV